MRRLILLAALTVTVPVLAHAQSQTYRNYGNTGVNSNSMGTGENCGTPDQWKPCPPLPRHPLAYYPGDREADMMSNRGR